jgi:hypothetical protein
MRGDGGRAVVGVVIAVALATSLPFGRALSRCPDRLLRTTESFAGGAALAYVMIDLMVELTGVGAQYVHALLPIGPTAEESALAIVLAGAAGWYIVGARAAKVGRSRSRYWAYLVPQCVYGIFVGGALVVEAEYGTMRLLLFAVPMLLHLTVMESHIYQEFEVDHGGIPSVVLAFAPGIGALGWAALGFSTTTLFMALAVVAGSTVVQIIQTELPSPNAVRIGPFVVGVCAYAALIGARWAGVV